MEHREPSGEIGRSTEAVPRSKRATELRGRLVAFAAGDDRSIAAVKRLGALVNLVEEVPWREELIFVLTHYAPRNPASGDEALAALAELVVDDWARKPVEPRWRLRVPDDAKGLDKRWRDLAGRERATAVIDALRGHGTLASQAFGTHDGRLDFRGFVDPGGDEHRREAVDVAGVDFSGARLGPLWFSRRSISGSRFDGATFADLRLWSSSITDTSFRGARMNETLLLDGHDTLHPRCRYLRVDFSDANLSELLVDRIQFEDCDFANARLDRSSFACDLVRCRFAGHLHDVSFDGRRPLLGRAPRFEDVDLSAAELHYVGFRDVDLASFRLPDDPDLRVVPNWACVSKFLRSRFAGTPEFEVPVAIRLAMVEHLTRSGAAVLELGTIRDDATAEGVADLTRLLDEAEAHCRS